MGRLFFSYCNLFLLGYKEGMSKEPVKCPFCRSTELSLIGGVFLNPGGVDYPTHKVPSFGSNLTKPYLRCKSCRQEFNLRQAREAVGENEDKALWEVCHHGMKIPIVCPACGNNETFVRSVVELLSKSEAVTVKDGEVEVDYVGGDVNVLHHARVKYVCGVDSCDGVVDLFPGEFHVSYNKP